MRLRVVLVLALVAVGLVGICIPAALMYRRLHPDRVVIDDDPGRHGLGYEPIAFASPVDGAQLRGWYMAAPHPSGRAIVITPGIDNNRLASGITLRLAPSFLAAGFDVLAFDLRGEGESGGLPITFGEREQWDVLGAVHAAAAMALGASASLASALVAHRRSSPRRDPQRSSPSWRTQRSPT